MTVVVGLLIMQDTVWDFALAKVFMFFFFHSYGVHAFSISHTFVRYQEQFRLLSNFGRRSDFISIPRIFTKGACFDGL